MGKGQPTAGKSRNLTFGPFRLEPANAQLWRGEERIALPPKPFDVLCYMAEHPGKLVTKDELLAEVWPGAVVEENNLQVHVSALRKALRSAADGERYLLTVSGRGYRFVAPVRAVSAGVSEAPASP